MRTLERMDLRDRPPPPHPRSRIPVVVAGLVLLGIVSAAPLVAQTADSVAVAPTETVSPGVVFGLGGGIGSQGGAGLVSLGIPLGPGEVVLRSGGTASFTIFGPSDATSDMGVLYGLRRTGGRGWARLAGGVGLVTRDTSVSRTGPCDDWNWFTGCGYDRETRNAFGLLAQAEAAWALHRNFGLGAAVYGGVGLGGGAYGALSVGIYVGRAGVTSR